jgi:hypothetical protein
MRSLILVVALFITACSSSPPKPETPAVIGMTTDMVRRWTKWGEPTRINKTVTAKGVTEQWVYRYGRNTYYLYFNNDSLFAIQGGS